MPLNALYRLLALRRVGLDAVTGGLAAVAGHAHAGGAYEAGLHNM